MAPSFKFDSQTFFLTYAQAGALTWQAIIDKLRSVKDITWARIAKEAHEDGQPHYHIVGRFVSRVQSKNARVFDVDGKHPNIQRVRSTKHALNYISKDGEFWDIGTVPSGDDETEDFDPVAAANDLPKLEYFNTCRKHKISFQYAKLFWEEGQKMRDNTIQADWKPEPGARFSVEMQAFTMCTEKANVVIGPSGHGKTTWAKSVIPKPALWVRHIDKLGLFTKGYHKGILFDEMVFTHYPRETQIQLVDMQDDSHIHCRYTVANIPSGTPRIFTANREVFIGGDEAINRRVHDQRLWALEPDFSVESGGSTQ